MGSVQISSKKRKTSAPVPPDDFVVDRIKRKTGRSSHHHPTDRFRPTTTVSTSVVGQYVFVKLRDTLHKTVVKKI